MKRTETGIKRIISATINSLQGFKAAWIHEEAFRYEIYGSIVLIPLSFFVGERPLEIAMLIVSCLIVILAEVINSAIESIVDRLGHEYHELSGRAKDLGSSAVFVGLSIFTVIWTAVIIERFVLR